MNGKGLPAGPVSAEHPPCAWTRLPGRRRRRRSRGTFFTYFLLEMQSGWRGSDRRHLRARDFKNPPVGCNMCAGSSPNRLCSCSPRGINLPPRSSSGDRLVRPPHGRRHRPDRPASAEKRIAAVHRGRPPGMVEARWHSFDGHLLELARERGANVIPERVDGISFEADALRLLEAGVSGGTTCWWRGRRQHRALKLFEELGAGYRPGHDEDLDLRVLPGEETIKMYLGSSMHVFLPKLPPLEFAAIIPKATTSRWSCWGSRSTGPGRPVPRPAGGPRMLPAGLGAARRLLPLRPAINVTAR